MDRDRRPGEQLRRNHHGALSAPAGTAPCDALLTLFSDTDTFDVLWFCPACDDNGRISGWEGTFWDNSEIGADGMYIVQAALADFLAND